MREAKLGSFMILRRESDAEREKIHTGKIQHLPLRFKTPMPRLLVLYLHRWEQFHITSTLYMLMWVEVTILLSSELYGRKEVC